MQSSEGPLDPSRPHHRELDLRLTAGAGAALTALVYAAMWLARDTGIGALFVDRGWIPPVVTWFSAWGLVVLFLKYRRLKEERRALGMDLLPTSIAEQIHPEDAPAFVAHLEGLDLAPGNPVVARLRRALLHFARQPDTSEVSRQLGKHAQAEADQVDSSYTLVRVFIWAVPILGFIGTVIGIGTAVGGFSDSVGGAADIEVMKESIGMVTSGLGVAFDTTLIALVMSIFLMFPSSSLQKSEEDFLALIEDYCDERLLPRLVDARGADGSDARVIQEAIAREMAAHHAELRTWQERLAQIGETLTNQVVTGWEKIDEQLRVRQQTQIDQLSRWASERQREASDELSETQRSLMRDFRSSLEGMAAEARRLQEEGVHRIDDQLASIERLHRRLQEDQQSAASAHREQSQALASSAEQLSHTPGPHPQRGHGGPGRGHATARGRGRGHSRHGGLGAPLPAGAGGARGESGALPRRGLGAPGRHPRTPRRPAGQHRAEESEARAARGTRAAGSARTRRARRPDGATSRCATPRSPRSPTPPTP